MEYLFHKSGSSRTNLRSETRGKNGRIIAVMSRSRLFAAVVIALVLFGCKRVSPEVKPTLDSIRPDARTIAAAAAKTCADIVSSGRFTATAKGCSMNKLPGEDIVPSFPSPAKGSALESNAKVVDVTAMCNLPLPGSTTESCGAGLGSLHGVATGPSIRTRSTVESNCKESPNDCEEIVAPSQYAKPEESADLRIVLPVAGAPKGANVEVTFVLSK